MIDRGATTVWERWNGVDAQSVAHESLNHYSKGAVVSFLHRYVAGLEATAPGYRTFRVRPQPGGGLTWASTTLESPYGPIEVSWRAGDEGLTLDLVVPGGTTAAVVLPDGSTREVAAGSHSWTTAAPAGLLVSRLTTPAGEKAASMPAYFAGSVVLALVDRPRRRAVRPHGRSRPPRPA